MAINSVSSMLNNKLRMTGMVSGLDTDALVKSMIAADKAKLDKAGQRRQLSEWRRDAYRDITSLLKTFKDDNFDVLKPLANMRSESTLAAFTTSYTKLTAENVSVISGPDATIGEHTINVTQLATQAQITSGSLTKDLVASATPLFTDQRSKTISITVDGTTKSLNLADYTLMTAAQIMQNIQDSADLAFGKDKVVMSLGAGNMLKFDTTPGSTISIAAETDAFSGLGFAATDLKSNRISTSTSLNIIANYFKTPLIIVDVNANITFSINGKTIDVGKSYAQATIADIIAAVNNSDAGVEMKYSSLTDKISLKNKAYGASNDLTLMLTSDLLKSLGIVEGTSVKTAAIDAAFDLDGVTGMKRDSNTFKIEGNTYTLKNTGEVKLSITKNTGEMVSRIKNFVTKYNELIDKLNGKYSDKYNKGYQPLTDDDKAAMDSATITKWESTAKVGLLNRDSILSSITSAMRSALSEKVAGLNISLSEIGISGSSYQDKGKLTIDETKLTTALNNRYAEVVSLFTKESPTDYASALTDSVKRTTRYSENGLSQRLYDILQNNIRTTNGKGTLLVKAGAAGDITEYVNLIDNEMDAQDKIISNLATKINEKSDKLYARFAVLETAMNKMNSQSSWLTQQSK